ncbi:radical SAM protein [Ruminococcus sp.]|uniref:radical SAM protein n=1 Tax=Ruminococcus sp. TaxID=41978 RepID=UPI0025E037CB|nr:radical SAM protein [Ruminococcus sp.]MCR4638190.1 radical SAM protein [Ruminococcus sp.]
MNKYINLERIEFVVTMGCTGKCRHCSEGSHIFSGSHIDGTAAARAIAKVCRHYDIKSLMTFGGEPLLYPETVCTIHSAAKAADIPQHEVITNGYFSKNENRIREVAQMLADSGVNRVLLSVDAFHQETIPLEPVTLFAESVRNVGVPIFLSPAWLRSPEDDNPYNNETHRLLKIFTDKGFCVSEGNIIFPQGNAKVLLAEYFDEDSSVANPYEDDPKHIRTLSFDPDGSVLGGNIYEMDILEIIRNYKP